MLTPARTAPGPEQGPPAPKHAGTVFSPDVTREPAAVSTAGQPAAETIRHSPAVHAPIQRPQTPPLTTAVSPGMESLARDRLECDPFSPLAHLRRITNTPLANGRPLRRRRSLDNTALCAHPARLQPSGLAGVGSRRLSPGSEPFGASLDVLALYQMKVIEQETRADRTDKMAREAMARAEVLDMELQALRYAIQFRDSIHFICSNFYRYHYPY